MNHYEALKVIDFEKEAEEIEKIILEYGTPDKFMRENLLFHLLLKYSKARNEEV